MKFISWNVNGLRACAGKGFADVVKNLDADFFCVQETKMQEGQLDLQLPGYTSYWNYAQKKGYSGTAIFSRHTPLSVTYGIGIPEHDTEGRVWEDAFRAYLTGLATKKGVIVCGDLNVAHEEIDLKNPATNHNNAGFTDQEREKFSKLLESGFTDSWRSLNPGVAKYSWWSYRFQARPKGIGWRIDYFLVSDSLKSRIAGAEIHDEVFGSDHCPVELILD